jgi:hypothetical protein
LAVVRFRPGLVGRAAGSFGVAVGVQLLVLVAQTPNHRRIGNAERLDGGRCLHAGIGGHDVGDGHKGARIVDAGALGPAACRGLLCHSSDLQSRDSIHEKNDAIRPILQRV